MFGQWTPAENYELALGICRETLISVFNMLPVCLFDLYGLFLYVGTCVQCGIDL